MELLINELIDNNILTIPGSESTPVRNSVIKHIVIAEEETFKDISSHMIQPNTLYLLSADNMNIINEPLLNLIAAGNSCVAVSQMNNFNIGIPTDTRGIIFTTKVGQSFSTIIENCYNVSEAKIQKLAEVSLEAMETLSAEILQNTDRNDNVVASATALLGYHVSYGDSDFKIQSAPNIPKEYLVQTHLCAENSFNWDLALDGFSTESASWSTPLVSGLNSKNLLGCVYKNSYCQDIGCRICIFPIKNDNVFFGYLLVVVPESTQRIPTEKGVQIQQLIAMLKFEIIKSDDIAHTINRYYDFLLDEILSSDNADDFKSIVKKYSLVDKTVYDSYYVYIAGRKSAAPLRSSRFSELLTSQKFNSLYDELVRTLQNINFFIFEKKDFFILFLPEQLIEKQTKRFSSINDIFMKFLGNEFQGIGISEVVDRKNIRGGYSHAQKALKISQHSDRNKICEYYELGVLKYFMDNSNQLNVSPLKEVYLEFVYPLVNYDSNHKANLVETISCYIDLNGSTSKICSELYIHKNTLYSRLNKISDILGKDLTDSETILNISLGLKYDLLVSSGLIEF